MHLVNTCITLPGEVGLSSDEAPGAESAAGRPAARQGAGPQHPAAATASGATNVSARPTTTDGTYAQDHGQLVR